MVIKLTHKLFQPFPSPATVSSKQTGLRSLPVFQCKHSKSWSKVRSRTLLLLVYYELLCSEFSVHNTSLRSGSSGAFECSIRTRDQEIRNIATVDSAGDIKLIHSPGFITNQRYILEGYNKRLYIINVNV